MSSYGNTIPRIFDVWYVEENKRKYPTVIPFHGILLSGMLRKNFRINELQCCSDVEFLVCKAIRKKMFKYWWLKTTTRWALRVGRDALGVGRDALGVTRYV